MAQLVIETCESSSGIAVLSRTGIQVEITDGMSLRMRFYGIAVAPRCIN
jgi:hypothetical protein